MPTFDARIDAHIAAAGDFARPILDHFRAAVHRAVPDCEEAIKWGMPHFTLGGRNLAGMAAFKRHVSIFFHTDSKANGTGRFRQIRCLDDLPLTEDLEAYIRAAVEQLRQGAKPRPRATPKPVPPLPQPFADALNAAAAGEQFAAMAPGYRRDYIEWIASARTESTRTKRIAQAVAWIGEGKDRSWQYRKC